MLKLTPLMLAFVAAVMTGCAAPSPAPSNPAPPASPPAEPLGMSEEIGSATGTAAAAGVRGMSFAEVQSCAKDALAIDSEKAGLDKTHKALNAEQAGIKALGEGIETSRSKIDATIEADVDAFNAKVRDHRDKIVALNTSIDEYNVAIGAMENRLKAYNLNCSNRPYRQSDTEKLSEAERKAFAEGATSFDLPTYFED